MATRIQIRRDTSIAWEANNPVLALGEPGLETDTFIVKYGDGSSAWNDLPYANIDSLADFTTSNLTEGSRLYFSNARVYANILTLAHATNSQLATYATNAQINSLTTASIAESGNLYFTNARSYDNVLSLGFATNNQLSLYATGGQLTLYATNAQLALYATNAQLASYATNSQLATYATNAQLATYATNSQLTLYTTNAQINALTTASITESGNLYFTNARVTSALTSNTANVTFGNVIRLVNYTYDEMQALAGAEKGWIIFETSNNVFRGYNGTAWSNLG